jgi:hypothetical protein
MRLEVFDGLGLAILEHYKIFLVKSGDGASILVRNNDIDQHVPDVKLERLAEWRIVVDWCLGKYRNYGGATDPEKGKGPRAGAEHRNTPRT